MCGARVRICIIREKFEPIRSGGMGLIMGTGVDIIFKIAAIE